MSRLEQFSVNTNPASLKVTWKSTDKKFFAYDTITKNKTTLGNISFIVLTKTVSIAGFNDAQQMGIFSNEVKNTTNEELIVRTKNGILAQGLYADIKDKLKGLGASFATNLYVILDSGETAVLQLSGAVLKAWFEYEAANKDKVGTHWVTIVGVEDLKKGNVNYSVPTFAAGVELNADETNHAEAQYKLVVAFRKTQEAPKTIEDAKTHTNDDDILDDIPY